MINRRGVELTNSRDDFRNVFPTENNLQQLVDTECVQMRICDQSIEEEKEERVMDIFKPNFEVYDTTFSHNRHRNQTLTMQKLSNGNAPRNPTLPLVTFNRN